jgi:hypothetical protein
MASQIEIWRSVSGTTDEDFSLILTVSDDEPFTGLDTPVLPGYLYIYKARRLDSTLGYSAFSPLAYGRGPWPNQGMNIMSGSLSTYTNPGWQTKIGVGIEPTPGAAVKAARLFDRVSGSLDTTITKIERKAMRNHPGVIGHVNGIAKTAGTLTLEVTPESLDELLCSMFGAPVTTAAAGPAAPAQPGVTVVGTAGAVSASYTVIASNAQGDSAASTAKAITTSSAALSGTNYNLITITPVLGATLYKVLKGGLLLGTTTSLTFQDIGQATSVYAAPAAAVGNIQTYTLGSSFLTVSILELRGQSVILFGGCQMDKLGLKYDKTASDPFTITADMMALYQCMGYTQAQLALDTAGSDPLGAYGVAPSSIMQIAGALADISSFDATIDRNLGDKQTLSGYMGPNSHYLQGSKHSVKATLYFSSEAEMQRYFNQVNVSGVYGVAPGVAYFPIAVTTTNPANAAGIVNAFNLEMPNCTYETLGAPVKGKDAIMQDVGIYPDIDPVTGTDVILQTVNSRSNASIITPTSLVTPVPGNALYPYTN